MIAKNQEQDLTRFGPKLSWDAIRRRHPDAWVVLAEIDRAPSQQVTAGRVAWSGVDRDAAHQASADLNLRVAAVYFTGRLRKDVRFLLTPFTMRTHHEFRHEHQTGTA